MDASRDGILTLPDARATEHPDEIAQRLVHAGVALTRLAVEEEDLETHFLRLVGMEQGEQSEKGGAQ